MNGNCFRLSVLRAGLRGVHFSESDEPCDHAGLADRSAITSRACNLACTRQEGMVRRGDGAPTREPHRCNRAAVLIAALTAVLIGHVDTAESADDLHRRAWIHR